MPQHLRQCRAPMCPLPPLLCLLADPAWVMVPSKASPDREMGCILSSTVSQEPLFLLLPWCRACPGCLVLEPGLDLGGKRGILLGGCGTARALAGLWALAALLWFCNKGLCLGEILSPALSFLGSQCPGRDTAPDAVGSPSGQSCCHRGLRQLWTVRT